MRDDSVGILFQSLMQEALVSNSGMGSDVHSLMLSIQYFLCWPQCRPPSKMPWRMVLERLSWCVTCMNHASFCLLTVASRGPCGPTRKLILLYTQSVLQVGATEKFPYALSFESLDPFLQGQQVGSMFHCSGGGWSWQETCKVLTCLQSWWCCTTRSCLVWPFLLLLGQFWFGLLLGRCHLYTGSRYLKLVTSSNFWLFMLISAVMLFVLLVMILLFSVLFCADCCFWWGL